MPQTSTKARILHRELIENIAAEVFWGYCFRTTYQRRKWGHDEYRRFSNAPSGRPEPPV
jgi:hypothetical protein